MTIEKNKAMCAHRRCDWKGGFTDLLVAPSPFDQDEELHGCPTCKSVDSAVPVCDEQGCWKEVSCGWPSDAGYRSTCFEHSNHHKHRADPFATDDVEVVDAAPSRPIPLEDADLGGPDWVDSVLGEP